MSGAEQSTATVGVTTTTYAYDGDGRRTRATTGGGTDIAYTWDPLALSGIPELADERTAAGADLRSYLNGPNGPLLQTTDPAGTPVESWYHRDSIGSITDTTSTSGGAQWRYSYDPYGAPRTTANVSGSAPVNRLRFNGQYLDPETGAYHLRARQYDPATGRFNALDPIETPTGDLSNSRYGYVDARPTTMIDPLGLVGVLPANGGQRPKPDDGGPILLPFKLLAETMHATADSVVGLRHPVARIEDGVATAKASAVWAKNHPASLLYGPPIIGAISLGFGRQLVDPVVQNPSDIDAWAKVGANLTLLVAPGLKTIRCSPGATVAANAGPGWFPFGTNRIPSDWSGPRMTSKFRADMDKAGFVWRSPRGQDSVRIDRGNPNSPLPSQRVDHVVINSGGRIVGRDGVPLPSGTRIRDVPNEAHIPLSEWQNGDPGMGANEELETPWLREELVDRLADLSSPEWVRAAVDKAGRPTDALDDLLDFLDDTGVVDEPAGRVGFILRDEREATALAELGVSLRRALDRRSSQSWELVASAASAALAAVTEPGNRR